MNETIASAIPDEREARRLIHDAQQPEREVIHAVGTAIEVADSIVPEKGSSSSDITVSLFENGHAVFHLSVPETQQFQDIEFKRDEEGYIDYDATFVSLPLDLMDDGEVDKYYERMGAFERLTSESQAARDSWNNLLFAGGERDTKLTRLAHIGDKVFATLPEADQRNHVVTHQALSIPKFKSLKSTLDLVRATVNTVKRISDLAETEQVQQVLNEQDVVDGSKYATGINDRSNSEKLAELDGRAVIVRAADGVRRSSINSRELTEADQQETDEKALKKASVRMLNEAATTIANTTAFLVAGIDKDLDMTKVIRSMDKNGVYKLFAAMMPSGVIGPSVAHGSVANPDFTLDQEMLAQGEFALSAEFRKCLIELHKLEMLHLLGNTGVTASIAQDKENGLTKGISGATRMRQHVELMGDNDKSRGVINGMGCPASSNDISKIAEMIASRV